MPWIHKKYWIGVHADLETALADPDAPTPFEGQRLNASDFEPVTAEEYDDTVLDGRYEHGEWQQ